MRGDEIHLLILSLLKESATPPNFPLPLSLALLQVGRQQAAGRDQARPHAAEARGPARLGRGRARPCAAGVVARRGGGGGGGRLGRPEIKNFSCEWVFFSLIHDNLVFFFFLQQFTGLDSKLKLICD